MARSGRARGRSPGSESRSYHYARWPAWLLAHALGRAGLHSAQLRGQVFAWGTRRALLPRQPPRVASAPRSDLGGWTAPPWAGSWPPTGCLRAFQLQQDGLGPRKTPMSCVLECENLTFEKARDLGARGLRLLRECLPAQCPCPWPGREWGHSREVGARRQAWTLSAGDLTPRLGCPGRPELFCRVAGLLRSFQLVQ